jgi:glycosyltransferase involved in cell wall biosynthesis
MELTIGMATYHDFDGVYFTVQALRLYQDLEDTEILVVDNYGCEMTKTFVEDWTGARYVLANEVQGTGPAKNHVFAEAQGDAVVACDSHVLLAPGVIGRLRRFYRDHPGCDDLLQGPLLYDDLETRSTHFAPEWRTSMWGTWATDSRGVTADMEPFEIPMQGLGAFSCRKSAWLGFNPRFRGFGGEEGYIHEKFRQAGRRTICLPWFLWTHRFIRPRGIPYTNTFEDRLHNYIVGHAELGLDLAPVINHFSESLSEETVARVVAGALWEDLASDAPAATEPESGKKR